MTPRRPLRRASSSALLAVRLLLLVPLAAVRSLMRRVMTTASIVASLLVGPVGPVLAAEARSEAEFAEARDTVQRFVESMRTLREALDPTDYDIEALSFELAFEDAATILRHVHATIDYEPYRGTLRGAAGTVATGAGNALDQALVVARLLGDAGHEVEIRTARLDDEAARAVLRQVRPERADDQMRGLDPAWAMPGLTEQGLEAYQTEIDRVIDVMRSDAARAERRLTEQVEWADPADELLEAAAEYAWVAFRWSEGDAWEEAHPIFGDPPEALASLEAEDVFADHVPERYQHRLRVQAFVERKLGDELEVVPIISAWERPTANLYGVARTFALVPDGLEEMADGQDLDTLADSTRFLFPVVEGALAPGAMAFDLRGNVVPPDAAASPMAGVFGEVSEGFGQAAGALGALGGDGPAEDPQALTAVWLEFDIIEPGGAERSHRRMLVDRIGPAARAAEDATLRDGATEAEAVRQLAGAHTYMADPGVYGAGYVLDRSIEAFAATSDYLHGILDAMQEGVRPPEPATDVAEAEEALGPLHLFHAFDAHPRDADVRSFRPAPGLVVMSQRIDGRMEVDVVANPRVSLRVGEDLPRLDPVANLRAGVWETRAEVLPLQRHGDAVSPSYRALDEGGMTLVRDEAELDGSSLPDATVEALREDLARGFVVLAPTAVQDVAAAGWWRVDPTTGETLGRGGDGRGNALIEYLTQFEVSVVLTTGFTVYGVHQCTEIEDPHLAGCCIVQNVAMAAVGAGVGAGAAVALNTAENLGAALAVFAVVDVGGNVGGMYVPTLCS